MYSDSNVLRISKAFVGILNVQNVLHLSQSTWKNTYILKPFLNHRKCLLNFADLIKICFSLQVNIQYRNVLSALWRNGATQEIYKFTRLSTMK